MSDRWVAGGGDVGEGVGIDDAGGGKKPGRRVSNHVLEQ